MTLINTEVQLPQAWIFKGCLCYPTPTPYLNTCKNGCLLVAYVQPYSNYCNATCLMNILKYIILADINEINNSAVLTG